jgi:hypothetical protein
MALLPPLFRKLPVSFFAGAGVVAILIAGVLYMQRGAHVEVKGSILKVRTLAQQDDSSIAVVDFRFANPSNYPFVVQRVEVSIQGPDGQTYEGATVSEVDARNLFNYYPVLGQKYNNSLLPRERVPSHQMLDRMIAARFEAPEAKLLNRRDLVIRVTEVDGAEFLIRERP